VKKLKFHLSSLLLVEERPLVVVEDLELVSDDEAMETELDLAFFSFGFESFEGCEGTVAAREREADDEVACVAEVWDDFLRISRRDCCAVGLSSTV
jgi:hypothetical protein